MFGFLGDLFGSTQEESGTSTTTRTPWGPTVPGLTSIANLVTGQLGTPFQFFPGQTYAPQTEAELAQIQSLLGAAGQWGQTVMPAWQSALGMPQQVLGMGLQDVASNPYVTGMAEAIQSRVNRNLAENIMPGFTSEAVGLGGLGGSRQGVAEGIAARGASDVLAEQLADLYGGAWEAGLGAETTRLGQGLAAQQAALGMAPGMMGAEAGFLGQAGGLQRAEEQRAINEAMARHEFEQMEPYQRAQLGSSVLLPIGGQFATGTTNWEGQTTSTPSPFQSLMSLGSLAAAPFTGGMSLGLMGGGLGGFGGFGGGLMGAGGFGMGAPGYGLAYGLNPFGQQANLLAQQWY